jgi:hypothetical protein
VIRHNDYVFRSEEQQHSFNFPYQLGTGATDQPKDAQVAKGKKKKEKKKRKAKSWILMMSILYFIGL